MHITSQRNDLSGPAFVYIGQNSTFEDLFGIVYPCPLNISQLSHTEEAYNTTRITLPCSQALYQTLLKVEIDTTTAIYSQSFHDCFSVLCGLCLAAEITSDGLWIIVSFPHASIIAIKFDSYLSFCQHFENCLLDLVGVFIQAHMSQHHNAT